MQVLNTHKSAIGLPGGYVLAPGEPQFIPTWPRLCQNAVIKAWVKAGVLVVTENTAAEPSRFLGADNPPAKALDEKEGVKQALRDAGIEFNHRWGLPKLLAALQAGTEPAEGEIE